MAFHENPINYFLYATLNFLFTTFIKAPIVAPFYISEQLYRMAHEL